MLKLFANGDYITVQVGKFPAGGCNLLFCERLTLGKEFVCLPVP